MAVKIPAQKIVDVLSWLYRTFLKGRKVKVGGQDVVLPSQGHGPYPAGQSPLDSIPHQAGPVDGTIPRR